MPWLSETNGTPQNVALLLIQIEQLCTDCNLLLSSVISHRSRCYTAFPYDPTHTDTAFHGPDYGGPARASGHTNLLNVRASLQRLKQELTLTSTEMSHGGNP